MKKQITALFLATALVFTNIHIQVFANNTNKIIVNEHSIDLDSKYKVTEIVDGDTIKIDISGAIETVRLLQVDTPESKHPNQNKNVPMGKKATEFTTNLLKDKNVRIDFDKERRDKYNRLLCYVFVNDKDGNEICVNEELIKSGMAKVVKYEPNVAKYKDYKALEKPVREAKKGIWENIEANYPSNRPTAQEQKQQAKENKKNNNSQVAKTNNSNNSVNNAVNAQKQLIKGNKKSKIYHCPGQRDYNKISEKNIVYFETEQQAQDAGYRKAKR